MLASMAMSAALALIVVLPVLAYGAMSALGNTILGLGLPPLSHGYLFAAWLISGIFALATGLVAYFACIRFAGGLFRRMDA